ncbi:hypothetical protein Nepgr_018249 [Nepenthes gracilis]|uniref:Uncharacterized protein n=1 Tax=Nepenthes gracilis TaxID=150966 RepID=A0AAD3XTA0_NEPGR|nr:hypothetical protein Nepgr_018249 [Nepenthes gracilis]
MASALLASRNESNWPQARTAYIGEISFLKPGFNNPNTNNSNPLSLSRKQQIHTTSGQITRQNVDEFSNPTGSDDASSLCRRSEDFDSKMGEGGELSHYISYDISTFSTSELRSLKSQLLAELEQVRCLVNRVKMDGFLSRSVLKNSPEKEMKLSRNKRKIPLPPSGKEPRQIASSPALVPETVSDVASIQLMKLCRKMLNKLMKQKFCWIFNEPVDVVALGLSDYNRIVKHPMDLGTVKSKLLRNLYTSPDEFAADVRLTFKNALLYNPKGEHVHNCAEQYLTKFEQMFRPMSQRSEIQKQQQQRKEYLQQENQIQKHPERQNQPHCQQEKQDQECWRRKKHRNYEKQDNEEAVAVGGLQMSPRSKIPSPHKPKKASSTKKLDQVEPIQEPPAVETSPVEKVRAGRQASAKLPKPKAKDPNKRDMSKEEKQKLGLGLQSLPDEKMAQVVQIIRKRNDHLTQDGDEIELDMETIDTETLWELDRFVINYKKMVSKIKRQALFNNVDRIDSNLAAMDGMVSGKVKKGGNGDEDVDIGDEMPMSHFPPLEIEKDDDGHADSGCYSSSSSSSTESSSSSDSDSGSSSRNDSDVENDAHMRD